MHYFYNVARVSSPASVLKRWKLNWCDLWIDGSLCFYKSDNRRELEHRVSLKLACIDVQSGQECGGTARICDELYPEANMFHHYLSVNADTQKCFKCAVF